MFYKKFSANSQSSIRGDESLRQRVLSLQFYLLGFLLVMTHRKIKMIDDLPKDVLVFIESLKDNYRLSELELRLCDQKMVEGIDCYYKSLMVHQPSNQKYIDLALLKETLKDYKLSFRGDTSDQQVKAVLMYLLDYVFHNNELINSKKSSKLNQSFDGQISDQANIHTVKPEIEQFIRACVNSLGFSNVLYKQLISMRLNPHQKTQLKQRVSNLYPAEYVSACKLLSVAENADMTLIRRQFNRFMRENHPDKLASKNLSEQELKHHGEMTHQYHKAFQTIKQYRNK